LVHIINIITGIAVRFDHRHRKWLIDGMPLFVMAYNALNCYYIAIDDIYTAINNIGSNTAAIVSIMVVMQWSWFRGRIGIALFRDDNKRQQLLQHVYPHLISSSMSPSYYWPHLMMIGQFIHHHCHEGHRDIRNDHSIEKLP
jgi:hypothetical protein